MARPKKYRIVCHYPTVQNFFPDTAGEHGQAVTLAVDEYETLRLIDKEGLSQEACGARMRIARTTVQQIYAAARKKVADALVDGRPLQIGGGDFHLCSGLDRQCPNHSCYKHYLQRQQKKAKGETSMRVAVTYENGQIFQHFGHTEHFKVYDINDSGVITASEVVSTNGSGHGALAGVLGALQADVLICGGIGGGAQMALAQAGIRLFGGCSGEADAAVQALIDGTLAYNPNVQCNHHGHDHDHGHTCGDHGCGSDHHCGH